MIFKPLIALTLLILSTTSLAKESISIEALADSERVLVIKDNFYYLENSAAYIGKEEIILLGATWSPKTAMLLHQELQSRFDKPVTAVINTNYHPDRAGGNAYWRQQGIDIYATQKTYDLMKSSFASMVEKMKTMLDGYPDIPLALPNKIIKDNDELLAGAIQTLYLGESHTSDGIMVYMPEEKVLYASCILKRKLGNLSDANVEEYPKTLQKLKDLNLDIKTIIAGHDEAINSPDLIDHYLNLLNNVEPSA